MLDSALARQAQAETRHARNRAAMHHRAQVRGRELTALRNENARLKARLALVHRLFAGTAHASISAEDWAALKNALEVE